MIVVFAIDALEHELVEEFNCENLKQISYGRTDISEFSEPRTMVLWSSFMTGQNKEEEILAKGDKEMWNTRLNLDETFFSQFKNPKVIDLPGYSYDLGQHKKERELLKAFFYKEGEEKEKAREEYNQISFKHHKKIKKEFLEALEENHDFVLGYFSVADVIGHLNFGNKTMMKMIYKELDELAKQIREKVNGAVLVISDHGMRGVGRFGDHSDYGFWSLNKEVELGVPKITDFAKIISPKKKILITGGSGFVGSHLANYLSKENEVIIYDKKKGDNILDFEKLKLAMNGVNSVFHLAALISVPESMQKPMLTEEVNVVGTLNVLKAAAENNVRDVVFLSSAAVYGELPELPKKEGMKLDPKSPYAMSKIAGEYYLKLFAETHGINTVTLRCFNIYGHGQNPDSPYAAVVPIFIKRALEENPLIIYGDGEQTRDFIYIKDVVKACKLALNKKFKGDIINIASGTRVSVKELANKILQLTNSRSEIKFDKERPGDVKHSYASNELAKEKLGWTLEYTLEQGLKEVIEKSRK